MKLEAKLTIETRDPFCVGHCEVRDSQGRCFEACLGSVPQEVFAADAKVRDAFVLLMQDVMKVMVAQLAGVEIGVWERLTMQELEERSEEGTRH